MAAQTSSFAGSSCFSGSGIAAPYSWERATRVSSAKDGEGLLLPAGAVLSSPRMYVVRSKGGDVGKFIADEGTAKVPINGKEVTVDDFEFLVLSHDAVSSWATVWAPPPAHCVWASSRMAVIRSSRGDPRDGGRWLADLDPGKFIADENAAKVPRNGKEVTLKAGAFEFLIVQRAAGAAELAVARQGADALARARGATSAAGAATAASEALAERGEKLSTLGTATEGLASEAQSFASMASQLGQPRQKSLFPW